MRFSHTADCHLGGHRDPLLRALSEEAFALYVEESIEEKVDFCIIAGDLFNTAIPGIDIVKFAVEQLTKLREEGIRVYCIAGSHDFSASGRTMLDVFEKAQLLVNVAKMEDDGTTCKLAFTKDEGTGVLLAGIPGKRGMLDRELYERLALEELPGEKIFLFHTCLSELKPKSMEMMASQPASMLPPGFSYYAGGHVHIVARHEDAQRRNIVYPGPLFPNSFSEFEELGHGGYWLYDAGRLERRDLEIKRIVRLALDLDNLSVEMANEKLITACRACECEDAIVLLRLRGTLSDGAMVDLRSAARSLKERGAYCVLRNTRKLFVAAFESKEAEPKEQKDVEEALLREHADELNLEGAKGIDLARDLLCVLSREQGEGERVAEYRERVVAEAERVLSKRTDL